MKNDPQSAGLEPGDPAADYQFALPDHLIAAYPPAERGDSRLLVVQPGPEPGRPVLQDRMFRDLPDLLLSGDLLITNDTRVSQRRVRLRRATGASIEALFLNPAPEAANGGWLCLVRGLKKLRPGEVLLPAGPLPDGRPEDPAQTDETDAGARDPGNRRKAVGTPSPNPGADTAFEFVQALPDGKAILRPVHVPRPAADSAQSRTHTLNPWERPQDAEDFFQIRGEVPIPPYLGRAAEDLDRQRYQTVYARNAGSVAAPTAGLHFTHSIIEEIEQKGVDLAALELEIGYGTFAPLTPRQFETGRLHTERYSLPPELVERLNSDQAPGRRVAVGTTTLRALEANQRAFGRFQAGAGFEAELFLRPPDQITTVDALITNFHLPGSSLVMLVACMLQRADLMAAYRHAIENEYRFFSYGDAMLVCRAAFCS